MAWWAPWNHEKEAQSHRYLQRTTVIKPSLNIAGRWEKQRGRVSQAGREVRGAKRGRLNQAREGDICWYYLKRVYGFIMNLKGPSVRLTWSWHPVTLRKSPFCCRIACSRVALHGRSGALWSSRTESAAGQAPASDPLSSPSLWLTQLILFYFFPCSLQTLMGVRVRVQGFDYPLLHDLEWNTHHSVPRLPMSIQPQSMQVSDIVLFFDAFGFVGEGFSEKLAAFDFNGLTLEESVFIYWCCHKYNLSQRVVRERSKEEGKRC